MKKAITVFTLIIIITACISSQHLQPTDADLPVAQQRVPNITMAELQRGYKIYSINCSGCHRLHNPKEYSASQWKPILVEMFTKAKLSDDQQKQLVINFLIAKSK